MQQVKLEPRSWQFSSNSVSTTWQRVQLGTSLRREAQPSTKSWTFPILRLLQEHMRLFAPKIPQIHWHPSSHHQCAMHNSVATRSELTYVEAELDKDLPMSKSKRRRSNTTNNERYRPVTVQRGANNREILLDFLNTHFKDGNDGNEYAIPAFVTAEVAWYALPPGGIPAGEEIRPPTL